MAKTKIYRVGLIGCGRIGSEWDPDPFPESPNPLPLTHAGAFTLLPRTKLVAGANRGSRRLEAFGHKWGVEALYHDYREMLEKENLDIVCIATHPELHEEEVIVAAQAGVKGIFCEKPIAMSLAETDAMIDACNQAGTILLVNHSRRWSPIHHKARQLIDEGAIGRLLTIVGTCQGVKPNPAWRAEEEGPLLHDATHTFDMFRFFAGDAQWVVGTASRRSQPFPVEDESLSIVQFKNGVTGVAVVNELTDYARFDVELQGTAGKITLGTSGNGLWTSVRSSTMDRESDETIDWQKLVPGTFPAVAENSSIADAAKELVTCLDEGKPVSSDGYDGRAAIEIIMAIYESQRRGNVQIPLPLPGAPSPIHLLREDGTF